MRSENFLRDPTRFSRAWESDGGASRNIRFATYDVVATHSFTCGAWISLNGNAAVSTTGSSLFSFGNATNNWFDFRIVKHASNATFALAVFGRRTAAPGVVSLSDTGLQHAINNDTKMFLCCSYNAATGIVLLQKDQYILSGSFSTNGIPGAGTYPFLFSNRVGVAQTLSADYGEAFLLSYNLNKSEMLRVYNAGAGGPYIKEIQRYATDSGLWLFKDDLTDSSGNGNTLTQYNSVSAGSPGSSSTPAFVDYPL